MEGGEAEGRRAGAKHTLKEVCVISASLLQPSRIQNEKFSTELVGFNSKESWHFIQGVSIRKVGIQLLILQSFVSDE